MSRLHGSPSYLHLNAVEVRHENALYSSLDDQSVQAVVGTFALTTLPGVHLHHLAQEVSRILAPGGTFAFAEMTVPPGKLIRPIFLGYLRYIMPHAARLFGRYCQGFARLSEFLESSLQPEAIEVAFREAGLTVQLSRRSLGCVYLVYGTRSSQAGRSSQCSSTSNMETRNTRATPYSVSHHSLQ